MNDIQAVALIHHLQLSYTPHVFDRIFFYLIALIFRNLRFPYKFLLHSYSLFHLRTLNITIIRPFRNLYACEQKSPEPTKGSELISLLNYRSSINAFAVYWAC